MPLDFSIAGVLVDEKPDFSGSGTLVEEPSNPDFSSAGTLVEETQTPRVQATVPPWMERQQTAEEKPIIGVMPGDTLPGYETPKEPTAEEKYGAIKPERPLTIAEKLETAAPKIFGLRGEQQPGTPPKGILPNVAKVLYGGEGDPGVLTMSPATLIPKQEMYGWELARQIADQINIGNIGIVGGLSKISQIANPKVQALAKAAISAYFAKQGAEVAGSSLGQRVGTPDMSQSDKAKSDFDTAFGIFMAGGPLAHVGMENASVKKFQEPPFDGLKREIRPGAEPPAPPTVDVTLTPTVTTDQMGAASGDPTAEPAAAKFQTQAIEQAAPILPKAAEAAAEVIGVKVPEKAVETAPETVADQTESTPPNVREEYGDAPPSVNAIVEKLKASGMRVPPVRTRTVLPSIAVYMRGHGKIYLLPKLLDQGLSDSEIAFIIAHETIHKEGAHEIDSRVDEQAANLDAAQKIKDAGFDPLAGASILRKASKLKEDAYASGNIREKPTAEELASHQYDQDAAAIEAKFGKPPEAQGAETQQVQPPVQLTAARDANVKGFEKPAEAPVSKKKLARGVTGLARFIKETELGGSDILDWIVDNMRMMSKSQARAAKGRAWAKQNASLWDDSAPLAAPHHNVIYSERGSTPDTVAQAAYDAGKLSEPSVNALWDAIKEASAKRKKVFQTRDREAAWIEEEAKQHQDWYDSTTKNPKGNVKVITEELAPGDVLEVDGERVEVVSRDEETGDVTLKDGRKFGTQKLEEGKSIYVEKHDQVEGDADFLPEESKTPTLRPGEKGTGDLLQGGDAPFNLMGEKGTDAERIAAEKAKAEQAAAAKAQAEKEHPTLPGTDANTGALGEEGMGGAKPGEFGQPGSIVSNMFAAIDADRASMGKPPMPETKTRTWDEDNTRALARMNRDPNWISNLIAEVTANPRPLLSWENAGLVWERARLKAETNNALKRVARAFDDGRADDLSEAKTDVANFERQLDALDDAVGRNGTGTEAGRTLQAQKMGARDDFTLVEMRLRKRNEANNGAPLTAAQEAEIEALHKKIAAYEDHIAKTQERDAARAVQDALDAAQRDANKQPVVEPHVRIIADKVKQYFDTRADAARKRLSGKLFTISPQVLLDLTDIGVSTILSGAAEITSWSAKMVGEFGDKIKPHLQTVWEASQAALDSQTKKIAGGQFEKVKRAVRGADVEEQQKATIEAIKGKVDNGEKKGIAQLVQRLARTFVEQGIKKLDPLIDALHKVLVEIDPTITRRDAMDAFSGYGDFKQLSKDQISVEIRDLKGQGQQVAKLEDITAKKPILKTGVERRPQSDAERRLIQQVNEAKRRFGVIVTDPARQLKSALDSIKTNLRNRISDLTYQIKSGQKIVRKKTGVPYDKEALDLKAERDALKAQFDETFGKPEMTDEQRVKMATSAVEKSILELERRIKEGDLNTAKQPSKTPVTPELEALRAKRDALKDQFKELQDLANPKKTPEERALASLKTRLRNRTAELQDKLARGDFSVKPKRETPMDAEATKLHFEAEKAKREFHIGLMKDRLAKRPRWKKILGGAGEAINTTRAIMTSMDLSAVLRQGGFTAFGHPIRALKSFPAMFRAFRSPEGQFKVEQEIMARPNYPLYRRSKLYLSEHNQKLSQMEEAYMSRWADKIPFVAGSQRAYVTFLNKLRADSFDAMAKTLARDRTLTPKEANAISNFINVSTGRGNLGMKENALVGLNTVFFAPRYVASRFQLLAVQPMYQGTAATRGLIASEYARYLIGIGVVYALANMDGAKVETDPRSSDFGKLRYGNTRVDPLSGLQQEIVLTSRLASGKTKDNKGRIEPIRGPKVPFGHGNSADVLARFARSKLAPVPGAIVDSLAGENVVVQPVTPLGTAAGLVTPLALSDIVKAMEDQGVPRGTAMAIVSIFGMGLQTYSPNKAGTR